MKNVPGTYGNIAVKQVHVFIHTTPSKAWPMSLSWVGMWHVVQRCIWQSFGWARSYWLLTGQPLKSKLWENDTNLLFWSGYSGFRGFLPHLFVPAPGYHISLFCYGSLSSLSTSQTSAPARKGLKPTFADKEVNIFTFLSSHFMHMSCSE